MKKNVLYIGTRIEAFKALRMFSGFGRRFNLHVLTIEDAMLDTYVKELNNPEFSFETSVRKKQSTLAALDQLLRSKYFDVLISVGFPYIITKEILDTHSEVQFYNLHPHILPKWKGYNAIKESIELGETIFGATFHKLTEGLDEGDAIFQAGYQIPSNDLSQLYDTIFSIIEPYVMISALKTLKL